MVSQAVLDLFPHEQIRDSQQQLIDDIEIALEQGKPIIAHAPTGLGKTASALSVCVKIALEQKKKIFFLTNRHTQHKIAVDTLKQIKDKTGKEITSVDLIGKRHMCSQEIAGLFGSDFNEFCKAIVEKGECEFYNNVKNKKGVSVEAKSILSQLKRAGPLHNEDVIRISKDKRMCSYEISLAAAKEATVLIGDYYYLFNSFVQATLLTKLDIALEDVIVIVDEAHNLPNRVTDMLSSSLTTLMLRNAVQEAQKFGYKGLVSWLQEINRVLVDMAEFETNKTEKKVRKLSFSDPIKKLTDYDELINELEFAADEVRKKQRKSYLGGVASFLEMWKGEDEGYVRILSEKKTAYGPSIILSYSCLDPSIATKEIFDALHGAVLMSGTLQPTFMYRDLLGLAGALEKEYPSPFPPENKLALVCPMTSTKYTMRGEAMYKQMAQICSSISVSVPGNVALFFPSYYLRDEVCKHLTFQKEKMWEKQNMSKVDKQIFLTQFASKKEEGAVLLGVTGANFAEGVDFPGDLLKAVVIIGLPLARPDVKTQALINYYDSKFGKGWDYGYTYPAMNKCIQSAGRCIRSSTDKGVIVYLDERFAWQRYFSCLPREGLRVSREYEKLVKEFFN